MTDDNIRKQLEDLPIPEPRKEAREQAVRTAKAEFRRQFDPSESTAKGFPASDRPRTKPIGRKGGPVMYKPIAITATVAVGFLALTIAIAPNFVSYRQRGAPTDTRPLKTQASAPQPSSVTSEKAPARKDHIAAAPAESQAPLLKYDIAQTKARKAYTATESGFAPDPQYVGRDRFQTTETNPVRVTAEDPVSTFSIDVDTASYAFVRRALQNGHLPPRDAVRTEELINYFDYDYPVPADRSAPFLPTLSVFPTPWNADTMLLHIGIKGYDIVAAQRPRSNLVFLVDVSGSMKSADKLPLLKNALRMLVETLSARDRVSIVVYAGAAGTVLEPTPADNKGKILAALDRLTAGGSTAGGEGIRQAYALAESAFDPDGINRVILATDGDFNVGIRDPEVLKNFVERKRDSGVYLSVLGFGQGNYNDALMQKLAQNGNGNAAYIDTLNEARKVLVEEAASTLFPIATDVKIQVEFNPAAVAEYRLIGYETRMLRREDFNNDAVDAGDVGAGHSVTALYEIAPVGSAGRLVDDLRYGASGRLSNTAAELAFLKIRYKLPGEQKSRLIQTAVDRRISYEDIHSAPAEARFAAAVAAFGQLLRGDPYLKGFQWRDVEDLARSTRGQDRFGYRTEFLQLVRLAQSARAIGDR